MWVVEGKHRKVYHSRYNERFNPLQPNGATNRTSNMPIPALVRRSILDDKGYKRDFEYSELKPHEQLAYLKEEIMLLNQQINELVRRISG